MFWAVKLTQECAWCMACRMLSQNQLRTNWCRDWKRYKQVRTANLKVVDHQKEPGMVCHRRQQTQRSIRNASVSMTIMSKSGYNLENKMFLVWGPFVNFLWKTDQWGKTFEVPLVKPGFTLFLFFISHLSAPFTTLWYNAEIN